jgi:hypothetical protein
MQGGLMPLKDYSPKNQEEINEYRNQIIGILSKYAFSKNQYQLDSQRIIYSNIIDLFEFNFELKDLKNVLDKIVDNIVDREDFIKSLYSQVSFIKINESQREFLINYIEILKNNSIEERILYNVSEPKIIIRTIKDEEGFVENGKKLAEKFAADVITEKINIEPYFRNLLIGNQYNSFDFGKKLSELSGYNKQFIDNLILEILSVENEQYNISFLFGYVSVFQEENKRYVFNNLVLNKSSFAFNIFRFIEINFNDFL